MKKFNFFKIINSTKLNLAIIFYIISLLIGAVCGHYFFKPTIDLCYNELPELILSPDETFNDKLKIYWGNKRYTNVKLKNFIFWNNSNNIIDSKILKNILIVPSYEAKILDFIILKYSRDNLKLLFGQSQVTAYKPGKEKSQVKYKTEGISISFKPNECLKYQDGVQLFIIYTSKEICEFSAMWADVKDNYFLFRKIETFYFKYAQSKLDLLLIFFIIIPYIFGLKKLFLPSPNLFNFLTNKFKKYKYHINLSYQIFILIYKILLFPVFGYIFLKIILITYGAFIMPKWVFQ